MEQQEKQFDTVLKKSVAMFAMLTGKPMTEREGRAFIEIFDMAEAYLANGAQTGAAAETFNILSGVDIPQFVCRTVDDDTTPAPLPEISIDPATLGGDHSVTAVVSTAEDGQKTVTVVNEPLDICGCRVGKCTCPRPEAKKRYTPPPITTDNRDHIPGYDWQIVVLSRVKDRSDSYVIHYAEMPTQAEFDAQYIKFQQQTHYVHVNEWVNWGWEGITKCYDTSSVAKKLQEPDQVVRTVTAPELRGRDVSASPVTTPWEQEDKAWRIRYFSDAAGAVIFHYTDKRPTAAETAHFHHAKCMAVSQAKPKQAA